MFLIAVFHGITMRFLLLLFFTSFPTLASASTGFASMFDEPITPIFIGINILLTIWFAGYRFNRFAVQHGPEVLTTVGILGCFLGIAVALMGFDTSNVSSSVPELLKGVKTAFWASLSGVAGSLVIRFRHHQQKTPIAPSPGAAHVAGMGDVVSAVQALQKSLAGSEEGSLLTQMKLMRQEQADQLGGLRASFDTFASKMAEDGSKALIEALKEVIGDFNTQINEQFGENFKHLNAAVGELVVWQQQYRVELDQLQTVQRAAADDLRIAAGSLSAMTERAGAFTDAAASMESILRGLAQQSVIIEQSQRSLSTVLVEMKDVAPQFAQKLDELASSMQRGVAKVQADVSDVVRNFGTQVQSSSAEMKQLLAETLKKSQKEVNDELSKGLDVVRQSVITLDKGLQEELTKSLELLGRQLASLSEKFVKDYTPLTERLRDVVQMAAR